MSTWPAAECVQFRYATRSDTLAVVALIESAYRGDASRVGWTTEADLLGGQRTDHAEISEILENAAAKLLLAVGDRELVGCVLIRRESDRAYLGMLAVSPTLQARGIGKRLVAEAEACAVREFGATWIRMTVIEQRSDLIAWYVRRGYAVTTKLEPFPYGNARFGLPKRDDLRFVVLEKSLI